MLSVYPSPFSQKRECVYYVPWLSLISFLLVVAGTITWGVGTSAALKNTNRMLDALRMNLDAELNTAQKVAVLVITGCCVLATGMLAMSSGRSCTEYAVDKKGAPARGSHIWLGASAIVTVLWWMVLVLLMFVFFVCVLWFGAMFILTNVIEVAVVTAEDFIEWGIQYHNVTKAVLEAQLGPLPDYIDTDTCPSNCLDLDIAAYFIGREVCICGAGLLVSAHAYAVEASSATVAVVVGCFLVWMGASFLLMNSTADFAQSRRERALLLRVQRALAVSGGGFPGAGGAGALSSDAPQQQVSAAVAGIELATATYGVQPKYGEGPYADVDKVPLLKNPQQAYPQQYHEQFQQQYQDQDRPAVVVVQQSDTPANGDRQGQRE